MTTLPNAPAAQPRLPDSGTVPPTVSGAALGDSNTGMHLAIGILTALIGREKTGKGQKVAVSMQDAVLNLCRVKLRDQERLDHVGYLEEYPQYPNGKFGDAVPRGGNAGGGGQPGWVLKCKGWQTDPNAYIYFTIQEQNWARTCEAIGKPQWVNDPVYATARARQDKIFDIFAEIEKWLADKTKFEAIEILRKFDVPCGPVLSMKEIENDPALRASGSIVEVEEEKRGKYLTVGSPIKFSDFTPKIIGAPGAVFENADQLVPLRGVRLFAKSGRPRRQLRSPQVIFLPYRARRKATKSRFSSAVSAPQARTRRVDYRQLKVLLPRGSP
jgi:formyl-CoA transferase